MRDVSEHRAGVGVHHEQERCIYLQKDVSAVQRGGCSGAGSHSSGQDCAWGCGEALLHLGAGEALPRGSAAVCALSSTSHGSSRLIPISGCAAGPPGASFLKMHVYKSAVN